MTLYITASYRDRPNTRTDHAIIQLTILDTNDNSPQFTRKSYAASVYLNTPVDAYLVRVEAIDKDLDANGLVEYSLENASTQPVSIDSESGVVRWQSNLSTRSDRPHYLTLTVVAKDTGHPSLASKAILLLNLIYRNKLPPHFDYAPFMFDLCELQPIGTRIGRVQARDPDAGSQADVSYKLLNSNDLFELEPFGVYNSVWLVSKFMAEFTANKTWSLTVRAYSGTLFTDTLVQVTLRDINQFRPFRLQSSFKLVFNNYKNYFLTEQPARVPVQFADKMEAVQSFYRFSLSSEDFIGKQLVGMNARTGEMTLKPILNSNNQINTSFSVHMTDVSTIEVTGKAQCELLVVMLSNKLIADSVTLNIYNVDVDLFLDRLYDLFFDAVLNSLPKNRLFKKVFLLALAL